MYIYSLILVFLIIVILYQVYSSFEGFETTSLIAGSVAPVYNAIAIIPTTTVQEIAADLLERKKAFKYYYDRSLSPSYIPKATPEIAATLGQSATTEGAALITQDFVRKFLSDTVKSIEGEYTQWQNAASQSPGKTIKEHFMSTISNSGVGKLSLMDIEIQFTAYLKNMNDMNTKANKTLDAIKKLNDATIVTAPTGPTSETIQPTQILSPVTGEKITVITPTTAPTSVESTAPITVPEVGTGMNNFYTSGNLPREMIIKDASISSASFDMLNMKAKDALGNDITITQSKGAPINSKPESVAPTSDLQSKEIESRIAKTVATQIKDELLADRACSNPLTYMGSPYTPGAMPNTNATEQGYELQQTRPTSYAAPNGSFYGGNQAPVNMNDYIRKDSIPCWGCSLPEADCGK